MGIEYRDEQQQEQGGIEDIGKGVVETGVEHQQHKTQAHRRAYPYNLHSRTGVETEDVGIAIGIAGSTDAYPSEDQQSHVDGHCPPVDRAKYARLLI